MNREADRRLITRTFDAIGSFLFVFAYFFISLVSLVVLFLLPSKRIRAIYTRLDAKEEEERIQNICPHVHEGDTVLDIGSGSGRFGRTVQERLKIRVTGVDVCDYADSSIPFFVYDGVSLPFPDKSFDFVFLAFVLHHTTDHGVILGEACRVARKKIIIFEDTFDWPWERLFTYWNDYHTNIFQGWIKVHKGYFKRDPTRMPMPLIFRSLKGWRNYFAQFPVKIASEEVRKMGYKPLKKVTFCLDLTGS